MDILNKIKNETSPVIIIGAGIVGEVLQKACAEAGIKVECFCDNNVNKTNDLLNNIPVVHTPNLKNIYKDAIFLISTADIKDIVDQLSELGYSKWYPCNSILRNFDVYQHQFSKPIDFVAYAVGTAILCHDSYMTPEKIFLRSVDTIVTERCSLRCRDCSNLMRYYKNPKDTELKEMFDDMNRLCGLVDEINEFRILGGEPFMNKDVDLIIKKLIEEPKVKKIVIYTNGTIVPREEQFEKMKDDKVFFLVTNYGEKLSRNLDNLVNKLKENKIAYYVQEVGGWTDCSKVVKHNRSIEEQKDIFRKCCTKNTFTISKGKIFRCPFSANAIRLKSVPNFVNDFVDMFEKGISDEKLKEKIRTYILKKEFLETCDYCNGRTLGDPIIQPAIQQAENIEYKEYDYEDN